MRATFDTPGGAGPAGQEYEPHGGRSAAAGAAAEGGPLAAAAELPEGGRGANAGGAAVQELLGGDGEDGAAVAPAPAEAEADGEEEARDGRRRDGADGEDEDEGEAEDGEDEDEDEDDWDADGSPRISGRLEAKMDSALSASLAPKRGARRGRVDDGFDGDKTVNEALDRPAVLTLYGMIRSGVVSRVNGPVSAGKESVVFWADGPGGTDVALKVYLVSTSSFKRRAPYILGDPRFGRIRRGTRSLVRLWARKEFANLTACRRCGIPVPEPIRVAGTVLAMEFVGSGGRPHSTLLTSRDICDADYRGTIALIGRLYAEARLVHADLSAYNVFKEPGGRLVLFDLGSAVDARHPRAAEFLERDVVNVTAFFARRGLAVDNPADVLAEVTARR